MHLHGAYCANKHRDIYKNRYGINVSNSETISDWNYLSVEVEIEQKFYIPLKMKSVITHRDFHFAKNNENSGTIIQNMAKLCDN